MDSQVETRMTNHLTSRNTLVASVASGSFEMEGMDTKRNANRTLMRAYTFRLITGVSTTWRSLTRSPVEPISQWDFAWQSPNWSRVLTSASFKTLRRQESRFSFLLCVFVPRPDRRSTTGIFFDLARDSAGSRIFRTPGTSLESWSSSPIPGWRMVRRTLFRCSIPSTGRGLEYRRVSWGTPETSR